MSRGKLVFWVAFFVASLVGFRLLRAVLPNSVYWIVWLAVIVWGVYGVVWFAGHWRRRRRTTA